MRVNSQKLAYELFVPFLADGYYYKSILVEVYRKFIRRAVEHDALDFRYFVLAAYRYLLCLSRIAQKKNRLYRIGKEFFNSSLDSPLPGR